ncbi:MAG: YbhB/YbcL family Raf kinase inhibitor-like protein [Moraxellaceae bacterium]|nr:MAG: YbhB/YbcL family Raf kinase inhibitor-like protein [Moraxellaceae bacterium]
MSFSLSSSALHNNAPIPRRYTAEGADVSPPLSWQDPPTGTRSYVLIVDDPDAPDPAAPKMTWVHWLLYNIPPGAHALEEGITSSELSPGTLKGTNDWKRTQYGGANPPIGQHRYFHKLYALDTLLPDLQCPTKDQLEHAMRGHVLGEAQLVATYKNH